MEIKIHLLILYAVIIFLSIFIAIYISLLIEVARHLYADTSKKSDAIFVLGAGTHFKTGAINPCLKARVNEGIKLYKDKKAPVMIFSGGVDRGEKKSEAEVMLDLAKEAGIDPSHVLLENKSTSTYENFLFGKKLMKKQGIDSIIIVTDPYHIFRASLVAQKLGINFTVAPASESTCWTKWKFLSRYFLKEPFTLMLYQITGQI
jgi:uncharacterized SAM-binding protein YcdF (DUF218 family)